MTVIYSNQSRMRWYNWAVLAAEVIGSVVFGVYFVLWIFRPDYISNRDPEEASFAVIIWVKTFYTIKQKF